MLLLLLILSLSHIRISDAKLADRSRIVDLRNTNKRNGNGEYRDNGRAIEGPSYRHTRRTDATESEQDRLEAIQQRQQRQQRQPRNASSANTNNIISNSASQGHLRRQPSDVRDNRADVSLLASPKDTAMTGGKIGTDLPAFLQDHRSLSSQLTGCCYNYKNYYATGMCGIYGEDCEDGGDGGSGGDGDCSMEGLSFIGISFSVNTANGNPYSYQLCDQFPMENIIDRDYNYVMSMDEDGWLVGGGYKSFDYSGKMPYIDSSHTELLRVGSMDPDKG